MRLTVKAEQIAILETLAQERFVAKIASELVRNYSSATVSLPSGETMTVAELPEDKLHALIKVGIEKAKRYEMRAESAIAGFVLVMFDVSPSFDRHRLSQVLLNDEDTVPDQRMNELLGVLSDDNWDSIRKEYDPLAWEPEPEAGAEAAEAKATTEPEPTFQSTIGSRKTVRPNPAPAPRLETDPNMQATIVDHKKG